MSLLDVGFGAQTFGGGPIAGAEIDFVVATASTGNAGGWFPHPRRKTPEEVKRERIDLGILPPEVQTVIRKAAKKSVATAKYKAERSQEPLPPIPLGAILVEPIGSTSRDVQIWLAVDAAARAQALRDEMGRRQLAWSAAYEQELRDEVQRLMQDDEDMQIVSMLFQHFMQ